MKNKTEIQIAWQLWNLISQVNDFIWDLYENEFIDVYLNKEEDKYLNSIIPSNDRSTAGDKKETTV